MKTPEILTHKSSVDGAKFIDFHIFCNNHKVPIYDVNSTNALNQLIGHAKFANASYGNVYYRGIGELYDNVLPALMRKRRNGNPVDLNKVLKKVGTDSHFNRSLKLREIKNSKDPNIRKLNNKIKRYNRYLVEALLQHYAGSTRFLDVVDNHWVALWMGLQKFTSRGEGNLYIDCNKKGLNAYDIHELIEKSVSKQSDISVEYGRFGYLLLLAMPHSEKYPEYGITETEEFVEVDLRKALPSFYLRPHAQHALVIRKRDKQNDNKEAKYYDMASQVVCILRIRIDKVDEWLGNGTLLNKENLFPSPSLDHGYHNLLERTDIFTYPFQIKKYF